jgi:hypothetical protein
MMPFFAAEMIRQTGREHDRAGRDWQCGRQGEASALRGWRWTPVVVTL